MAEKTKPAGTAQTAQAARPMQANAAAGARPRPGMPVHNTKAPAKIPKKKASAGLVFSLFLILLFGAAIGMIYFDIAGLKDKAVTALQLEDPTKLQLAALDAREKEFVEREAALASMEEEKNAQSKDLKARERALSKKEKELQELEEALTQKQAELDALSASLDVRRIELDNSVQMFSEMDPEKAAKAISGIRKPADIALLLLHMDSEKSAAILNYLQSSTASKVMAEIIAMQKATSLPQPTAAQ